MAGQLLQTARRPMSFKVGRRSAQNAVIGHQLAGDEVRRDLVAHANIEIEALGHNVHQPVEHFKPYLQRRMRRHQPRHHRRHHIAAETEAAADAQQAARHIAPFGHFVQQAVEIFQDSHGMCVHPLAVLADDDAARGAVEQLHAQYLLQDGDTLADIGRRHAQLPRRRRKAGLARGGGKDAEVFVIDTIIHGLCFMDLHSA